MYVTAVENQAMKAGNATEQNQMAIQKSCVSNRLTFGMMEVHVQLVLWE